MKSAKLALLMLMSFFTISLLGQAEKDVFSEKFIKKQMIMTADWQFENLFTETPLSDGGIEPVPETGWIRGAFYTGVMALYKTTGNEKYLNKMLEWGEGNNWQPGKRERHADDHVVGQTYLDLFFIKKDKAMIAPLKKRFDKMIKDPKWGPVAGWTKKWNWSWCDALFMAPPAMVKMSVATGDEKYIDLMNRMWWNTYDHLYSKKYHLFYRDDNYISHKDGSQVKTKHGKPVFWGRGNGWVMGGLVRVLDHLSKDYKDYERYVDLYKEMSEKIASLQGKDGLWRSSLLDPKEFPQPETSCSGFFCYALTWGINNDLLCKDEYLPVVKQAWVGLNGAMHPNGKLGWVQQVGHDPRSVSKDDTMEYGTGAFLLAGSEIIKLDLQDDQ
ncbi:MAG: glycoside hydrolase family 88 protein [candidate division KSB1 bacterium]|nr:glycoside hydrolase family 88 protein [candidate division KSB1 bacterium]